MKTKDARGIYQGDDDLAIRVGHEFDVRPECFSERYMVVNFSVHSQDDLSILTYQWLSSCV